MLAHDILCNHRGGCGDASLAGRASRARGWNGPLFGHLSNKPLKQSDTFQRSASTG